MSGYWPIAGLRLRTERLELRSPTAADLDELADLAAEGIHDPAVMPFTVAWTDGPPDEVARSVVAYHWRTVAALSPEDWRLDLVACHDGAVIGTQAVEARRFAVRREVSTGSWLGKRFQGRRFGTEMRAAVLHLAFAGLGARYAVSDAFTFNAASLGVSRSLGYRDDGLIRYVVRDAAQDSQSFRLDRDAWAANRRHEVTIEGLEPCLPLLGVS